VQDISDRKLTEQARKPRSKISVIQWTVRRSASESAIIHDHTLYVNQALLDILVRQYRRIESQSAAETLHAW